MNGLVLTMFLFVVVVGVCLLIFISVTRQSGKTLDQSKYRSRWLAITQATGSTPDSWQFAIVSADKLLDAALKDRGVRGETMAERLKSAKSLIPTIDDVWRAHKLRNKIAHEDGFTITKRQANDALKSFKQALISLGAL